MSAHPPLTPLSFGSQPMASSSRSLQPTPCSAAGRKRSRGAAADTLEDDDYFAQVAEPEPENEDEWVYGEGMTLIKPNGYAISASSQTGTWAEEKAEELSKSRPQTPNDRPLLRSHKSQRLDFTATPSMGEEASYTNGSTHIPSSPPKSGMTEPTVDDFTIHLGIGWSRINDDEHIQAAARGWAKYIENHYPVSGVEIRLQSKGLQSYLVEAQEGFFLFGEDLKQGRLVSTSLERTFKNLQSTPPIFDAEKTMQAAVTPKLETIEPITHATFSQFGNTLNQVQLPNPALLAPTGSTQNTEVDMDMS
jgi:hypothetical protein